MTFTNILCVSKTICQAPLVSKTLVYTGYEKKVLIQIAPSLADIHINEYIMLKLKPNT